MLVRFQNVIDAIRHLCGGCRFFDDSQELLFTCNHPCNDITDVLVQSDRITCYEFKSVNSEAESFYFKDLED